MTALPERLPDLARAVLTPLDAPAAWLCSRIVGPEEHDDVDEWVALDLDVARRIADAGSAIVLRAAAHELAGLPRVAGITIEAVVTGPEAAHAVARALDAGVPIRAALASGETGIDVYRSAAAARHVLGTRVPIRARWDDAMDVKGAALALTFGADELAGPLAPVRARFKLAQIGGPPESAHEPGPSYVEQLIRAAQRYPVRRR
jgi:hypothetical protein